MTKRTLEQNSRLWAMLTDLSRQLKWAVDGELQTLSPEDWKVMLTAGLKREQRIAKGIWGGFVMLGVPTSKMTIPQMTELIDLIFAFGAERNIAWSDPALPPDDEYTHEVKAR